MFPTTNKFLAIFLLLLAVLTLNGPVHADNIYKYLKEADELYQSKNYNRALFHYKNALQVNPSSLKALLGVARCSIKIEANKKALQAFRKILKLEPKNMEAVAGVAKLQALEGKYRKSLTMLNKNLRKKPYNSHLLLARIEIYLMQENYAQALRKLEDAKGKTVNNTEFKLLYAKVNASSGNFRRAKKILKNLTSLEPENPDLFREYAKISLQEAVSLFPSTKVEKLIDQAQSNLLISLALNQESDKTKSLLMQTFMWFEEYANAQQQCKDLLQKYPENGELHYLNAYLAKKLGSHSTAIKSYVQVLRINDLDEIGRYSAESFSLQNLSANHWLRNNLGKYRLWQNRSASNNNRYGQAGYSLMRSRKLIPDNRQLRKFLSQYYYRNGYLQEMIHLLKKIRNDEPRNIKIHNRLERALRYRKNSLSYREGYTTLDGEISRGIRNTPKIFLFDLQPDNFLKNYPDTSLVLTNSIKFSISLMPNISVLSDTEEKALKEKIRQAKPEYKHTQGVFYSPDILNHINLDAGRLYKEKIRYVGYGTYSLQGNELKVNFVLYDRQDGQILKKISFLSSSQNYVSEVSVRLAKTISSKIPRIGRVLKIKNKEVVINLGYRDGIRKKQVYRISRNGRKIGNVCIKDMDEFLALATPIGKSWQHMISSKDIVERESNRKDRNPKRCK